MSIIKVEYGTSLITSDEILAVPDLMQTFIAKHVKLIGVEINCVYDKNVKDCNLIVSMISKDKEESIAVGYVLCEYKEVKENFIFVILDVELEVGRKYAMELNSDAQCGNAVRVRWGVKKHYKDAFHARGEIIEAELNCNFIYNSED